MLLQELRDAGVTKVTRSPESSSAIVCSQSVISFCFQKLFHHLQVTLLARHEERASSVLPGLVDGCSPSQKLLHYLQVTQLARNVERNSTPIALYIDVCPCLNEGTHHLLRMGALAAILEAEQCGDGTELCADPGQ